MAVAEVLQTVELLEMVILKLPARDVFISQRVSKLWRSNINHSVLIQEALFLKPTTREEPLARRTPFPITTVNLSMSCTDILATPGYRTALSSMLQLDKKDSILRNFEDLIFQNLDHLEASTSMTYAEASWRKMLIAQPPITRTLFISNYRPTEAQTELRQNDLDIYSQSGGALSQERLEGVGAFVVKARHGITASAFVGALDDDQQRWTKADIKGSAYKLIWADSGLVSLALTGFVVELLEAELRQSMTRLMDVANNRFQSAIEARGAEHTG